jgi:cell division protein FtsA
MENTKYTACLEISSDYAKFAVGNLLHNQPIVLYYAKKPLKGGLLKGEIDNPKLIQDVIKNFLQIEDENLGLKINGTSVSIVVPPLGFEIYRYDTVTNVIASTSLIDKIDIANVLSLVKKVTIPYGNMIVDIVPDAFILSNGKGYANPPLGEKSDSLAVQAKIHTLPEKLIYDYRSTVEGAGFRLKRACVAPYCASQLLATDKTMPETYIYIDIGAHLTTVSFIGKTSPFGSLFFAEGGDDLTRAIAEAFSVSYEDAELLKDKYGYDPRISNYQMPLIKSKDDDGKPTVYYQNNLNAVIENFFDGYDTFLNNAITALLNKKFLANSGLEKIPLVFGGGGSLLYGLSALLVSSIGKRQVYFYTPKVIGARDPGAINLLGLICAEGSYRGTLEDNYHGVSTLSRDRQ